MPNATITARFALPHPAIPIGVGFVEWVAVLAMRFQRLVVKWRLRWLSSCDALSNAPTGDVFGMATAARFFPTAVVPMGVSFVKQMSVFAMCIGVGFLRATYAFTSSFCRHVSHVVLVRAQPQMLWVATSRIVPAGAIVQDMKAVAGAVGVFPSKPSSPGVFESPVSVFVDVAGPQPTGVWPAGHIDLCPEIKFSQFFGHTNSLLRGEINMVDCTLSRTRLQGAALAA